MCVFQYLGGGAWTSAERHRGQERDKSQPDLQLPQEQDVQKDKGEAAWGFTAPCVMFL